jgi:predicted secreted protein
VREVHGGEEVEEEAREEVPRSEDERAREGREVLRAEREIAGGRRRRRNERDAARECEVVRVPVDALRLRATLAFGLALAIAGAAAAQPFPADPKNRASFSVERSREVANDWITAVVGTSDEDSDAARLADRVNQTMNWGLGVAKQARGVSVKSGGYTTHPVHDKSGKIARWSASQDLILESSDVDAVSELVGKLQSKLLLRSISFSVSPETRRKAEDALIGDVLTAFAERAKRVSAGLGARDYEIVSIAIQTPGGVQPVEMFAARARMMEADAAPPEFESGQSTLSVRVDATIEIEK